MRFQHRTKYRHRSIALSRYFDQCLSLHISLAEIGLNIISELFKAIPIDLSCKTDKKRKGSAKVNLKNKCLIRKRVGVMKKKRRHFHLASVHEFCFCAPNSQSFGFYIKNSCPLSLSLKTCVPYDYYHNHHHHHFHYHVFHHQPPPL